MDRFKLKVCLDHRSIEEIQKKCNDYLAHARILCGDPVNVADIFKMKHQKHAALQARIEENTRQNYEKWKNEQEQKAIDLQKFRTQQREELKLQMEEIREQKLSEKKANIERELMYLKEAEAIEDQRLLAENIERKKRIEYYEELNRLIDEKKRRTERLVAKLKSELQNKERLADTSPRSDGTDGVMAMSLGSDHFITPEDEKMSNKLMTSSISVSTPSLHEAVMNENYKNLATSPEPNMNSRNPIMQKSESDILNANLEQEECAEVMITDFQRNRKRAMDSTIIDRLGLERGTGVTSNVPIAALTQAQKNKMKVLSECYHLKDAADAASKDEENNLAKEKRAMTTAEKNKMKILSSEFGIELDEIVLEERDPSQMTDAQRNKVKILGTHYLEENMTDLQKNRFKTMQQEFELISVHKGPDNQKSKPGYLNLDTDRARNRKKVLESEFNIITGELMDSPDMSHFASLKLDTEIANHDIPDTLGVPSTSVINQPTPDSALLTNERPITVNHFKFVTSPTKSVTSEDGGMKSATSMSTVDSDPNYYDFVKLVERKMNSLMPLALPKSERGSSVWDEKNKDDPKSVSELKCLDVTTLTRFLQKSLVLPLNAHMEIINGEIMKLFLLELDVIGHFKSLRNYFFMMDGEFGSHICDGLLKRMEGGATPNDLLNPQTLHSLLDHALGSSIIGNDKNTDHLTFKVGQKPEKFDLTSPDALSMLSLDYQVTWPLNLVLNFDTITEYSYIFKYLVKIRRIGWVLESSFQYLKEAHKKLGTDLLVAPQYRRIQEVRHKLSQFMHALLNHITRAGLQVSWKALKDDLNTTVTMEDLYRKHVKYIKRIKFLCLLTRQCNLFHSVLETIFAIILQFYR